MISILIAPALIMGALVAAVGLWLTRGLPKGSKQRELPFQESHRHQPWQAVVKVRHGLLEAIS